MQQFLLVIILFCFLSSFFAVPVLAEKGKNYLEISDILKYVYQKNPSLQAARAEFEETKELYPQARAGWLPTLKAETSIYASDIENSNFNSGDGTTTKDLTLTLDQPIWRGGRTFAETARAENLIRAGEAILQQTHEDVFLEAVVKYMNVLRDRELLNLREKNEEILMQELRVAWEKMDIGDITDTDVQQAKSRLAKAKAEHIEAQKNLAVSEAEFEEIIGIVPSDKLTFPYIDFNFPEEINKMIGLAEKRNPSLLVAKHEHGAAKNNAKATSRELLPQVSAYASHNKQYDPQPGIVDDTRTQTVGVQMTLALYEGGGTRSRIREANMAVERQRHGIEEARRKVRQKVISNWQTYRAAKTVTEIRKEEIEAAQAALNGIREETRLGQRTVIDILDADEDLIDARVSLTHARRDEMVSKFSLASTLGLLVPHYSGSLLYKSKN